LKLLQPYSSHEVISHNLCGSSIQFKSIVPVGQYVIQKCRFNFCEGQKKKKSNPSKPPLGCADFGHGCGWKDGHPSSEDPTSGIYMLHCDGKVYVGKSIDINRRYQEHSKNHQDGTQTVGEKFKHDAKMTITHLEVIDYLSFYEQYCIEKAEEFYGKENVINAIDSMNYEVYESTLKKLSENPDNPADLYKIM